VVSVNLNSISPPASEAKPPDPVLRAQQEAADKRIRILTFIDDMRVGGVRIAGNDCRVLLNDRVYRVNSMVSMELGLRLTGVTPSALTLVDEDGVVYTKTL